MMSNQDCRLLMVGSINVPSELVALEWYDGALSGWLTCICCHGHFAFAAVDWDVDDGVLLYVLWRQEGPIAYYASDVKYGPGRDGYRGGVLRNESAEVCKARTLLGDPIAAVMADSTFDEIIGVWDVGVVRPEFIVWPYSLIDSEGSGDLKRLRK